MIQSARPEQFFDEILSHVARAEKIATQVHEIWFVVAGLTVQLRFLGDTLLPHIVPALAHLQTAASKSVVDLTLNCWDCDALGIEFPTAPVGIEAFTPRGEIHGLTNGRFHAAFDPGGRQLSLFDAERRQGAYCVGVASAIPRFEIAEPLRPIFSWLMRQHNRQLIHAAAVGEPNGGVLLIGCSGSGKSNTALGCLASNLRYASDDFCVVSVGSSPTVYSLYCTGKTHEIDWKRHPILPGLAPNVDPQRREKAIYFLAQTCPHKLICEFPLKAILLPRRGGAICEIRPISPAEAVRTSAPDTARLLPNAGPEVIRCIAQLARTVPCYELQLGPSPEKIAGVISTLLERRIQTAA